MKLEKISLAETRAFNSFFLDYIEHKETLRPFYNHTPELSSFKAQLSEKQRSFPSANREVLVSTLVDQYKGITKSDAVEKNITSLRDEKTFTITTGHQLNIFTGPLYFIYKIVTVINTCRALKKSYPEYTFVPVYWMASEDHDYDEIKSFRLLGKKYSWETSQTGAVGRFHLKDFPKLLAEVPGDAVQFREAYTKNKSLSDAVRQYVNALFGEEGLVVLDADARPLKSLFREVMRQDIFEAKSKDLVEKTNAELESLGYKTQIFCRDINFFYLDGSIRSRLEKQDEMYHVVDTTLSFTKAEIEKIIDEAPEKLSPNVILRPLYEEFILPDLAYVGGPAEVIYWLQLKRVFDHFSIPFPVLMPRNFAMIVEHTVARKFEKTDLMLKDLFEEKNFLFNHWVLTHSQKDLTVSNERKRIQELFDSLRQKADKVDKTLLAYIDAQGKRAFNGIEKIEHKLIRAEKRNQIDKLRQIETVKDALFPNGSLQERTDNFLNFYQQDPEFVGELLRLFDPFDYRFNILSYERP